MIDNEVDIDVDVVFREEEKISKCRSAAWVQQKGSKEGPWGAQGTRTIEAKNKNRYNQLSSIVSQQVIFIIEIIAIVTILFVQTDLYHTSDGYQFTGVHDDSPHQRYFKLCRPIYKGQKAIQ